MKALSKSKPQRKNINNLKQSKDNIKTQQAQGNISDETDDYEPREVKIVERNISDSDDDESREVEIAEGDISD